MTKRMLIDAAHAEETRVVVLDGNRLEDFDVETSTKRQLKGNIYLAKVVRVEPSLQAAFVEYGGNRHGFLAFGEIHPDYYQIPVADRQRLLALQAEEARREEEAEEAEEQAALATAAAASGEALVDEIAIAPPLPSEPPGAPAAAETVFDLVHADPPPTIDPVEETDDVAPLPGAQPVRVDVDSIAGATLESLPAAAEPPVHVPAAAAWTEPDEGEYAPADSAAPAEIVPESVETAAETTIVPDAGDGNGEAEEINGELEEESIPESLPPETVGGDIDAAEESRERRAPPRFLRNYKIQEVIHRRQILLVQVVKEERGTKGAALTTYISLAGRYCVLMPNSPRGGGISRKITAASDRRRLKEVMAELDIPDGMGLIVRTAGANRPKPEIKRDCEYLLRLWDEIREHTLKSVAPALIYEEASLIKRAIRDVYSRDIDEILVDGETGWKAARDFMRMLMPTHVRKVQLWRDPQPLFARQQVDAQLDAILSPTVQLRSGGYLVINQTEALVAIDVNSGRSTRERGIEETALRTNLEAADEVARQLRLRDLAGLIVIDFIDMESRKNNAIVERRLKEALKDDRARIQVGHISHFGLMEMSRQRLRPSLAESSFVTCPHCGGTGHVRGTESAAIHVLREIEEEGAKRRAAEIVVRVATSVAMYILNHKRARLAEIESHYAMHVAFAGDDSLIPPQIRIERVRTQALTEAPVAMTQDKAARVEYEEAAEAEPEEVEAELEEGGEAGEETGPREGESADEQEHRHRRRRRRRPGRRDEAAAPVPAPAGVPAPASEADLEEKVEGVPEHAEAVAEPEAAATEEEDGRGRRRGRRGGRRRRREGETSPLQPHAEPGAEQPDLPPVYVGPTPADPFAGHGFDIFDMLERVEEEAARPQPTPQQAAVEVTEPATLAEAEPEPVAAVEIVPPAPLPEPAMTALAPVAEQQPEPAPEPAAVPANDLAPEPLVKPILVGAEQEPVVEKKRGWWRR
jgi:ribonuclease E